MALRRSAFPRVSVGESREGALLSTDQRGLSSAHSDFPAQPPAGSPLSPQPQAYHATAPNSPIMASWWPSIDPRRKTPLGLAYKPLKDSASPPFPRGACIGHPGLLMAPQMPLALLPPHLGLLYHLLCLP